MTFPVPTQTTVPVVLQDHHTRIRALEAAAVQIYDDAWIYASGTFTNSWVDNTLVNVLSAEPAVSYLRTKTGWVALRGRVSLGNEGKAAFLLPAGLRPPHNMWFDGDVSNGGIAAGGFTPPERYFVPGLVGRVLITTQGYVHPYLGGSGFGTLKSSTLLDGFGSAAGPLLAYAWVNGNGAPYAYLGGGGGFSRSGAGGDTGALYLGTDLYAESECFAVVGSTVPDRIQLGLRCQYQATQPTLLGFPPGYWMNLDVASGGNVTIFTQTSQGVIDNLTFNAGTTTPFTNPAWATGDVVGFAINGTYFTLTKNGVVIFQVQVGLQHTPTFSQGLFGLGAQGANGVQLVTSFKGGLQRQGPGDHSVGVSLNQVFFKNSD